MSIRVMLPAAFARHTAGTKQVQSEASNLPGLVDDLGVKFPELGSHIRDTDGTLRKFINVYVNDEDIRFLGGDTYQFQDRDEVMFIPSIAGGLLVRSLLSKDRLRHGFAGLKVAQRPTIGSRVQPRLPSDQLLVAVRLCIRSCPHLNCLGGDPVAMFLGIAGVLFLLWIVGEVLRTA